MSSDPLVLFIRFGMGIGAFWGRGGGAAASASVKLRAWLLQTSCPGLEIVGAQEMLGEGCVWGEEKPWAAPRCWGARQNELEPSRTRRDLSSPLGASNLWEQPGWRFWMDLEWI
jgi:hypothetical protein